MSVRHWPVPTYFSVVPPVLWPVPGAALTYFSVVPPVLWPTDLLFCCPTSTGPGPGSVLTYFSVVPPIFWPTDIIICGPTSSLTYWPTYLLSHQFSDLLTYFSVVPPVLWPRPGVVLLREPSRLLYGGHHPAGLALVHQGCRVHPQTLQGQDKLLPRFLQPLHDMVSAKVENTWSILLKKL